MADIEPITVVRGDALDIVVTVRDTEDELVDISTAEEIRWTMTQEVDGTLIVEKTLADGIAIANDTSFVISLSSADTLLLPNPLYWPELSVAGGGTTPSQDEIDASVYHEARVTTGDGSPYTVISGRIFARKSNAEVE